MFTNQLTEWGIKSIELGLFAEIPPPTKTSRRPRVTIVRHPYYLLENLWSRMVSENYQPPHSFSAVRARYSSIGGFIEFYERIVESRGIIGNCLKEYYPDCCLRFEDFPWCLLGFFESIDHPTSGFLGKKKVKPVENKSIFFKEDQHFKELRSRIVKSELSFCERFEYF